MKKKTLPSTTERSGTSRPSKAPLLARSISRHGWKVPAGLVLLVGAINFTTMPAMFYPGDNVAPRMELADWLTTGQLGIDYSHRQALGGFIENRGQYLYENDAKQKFFSKYGFGNTLLYAPPYLWHQWSAGGNLNAPSDSLLFKINVWQVFLSMLFALYLYMLAMMFADRPLLAALFVLAVVYTSYVWHYLRSPTLEIFQMTPFLASVYHTLAFLRARNESGPAPTDRSPWRQLLWACVWSGILVQVKTFFVIQFIPVWIVALTAGHTNRTLFGRCIANVKSDWRKYALYLALPSTVAAGALLWSNTVRFGSPFETGYSQWILANGSSDLGYNLSVVPKALKGIFIVPGQYNGFFVFPLFGIALFGCVGMKRRYSKEFWVLMLFFALNLFAAIGHATWTGAWCYGPRYQIHILTLGSLPALVVADWIGRRIRRPSGIVALATVASILTLSLGLQARVNSVHYFADRYLMALFGQFKHKSMESAVREMSAAKHRAVFFMDVNAYLKGRRAYRPMKQLRALAPPEHWPVLEAQIDEALRQLMKPNFFFLR